MWRWRLFSWTGQDPWFCRCPLRPPQISLFVRVSWAWPAASRANRFPSGVSGFARWLSIKSEKRAEQISNRGATMANKPTHDLTLISGEGKTAAIYQNCSGIAYQGWRWFYGWNTRRREHKWTFWPVSPKGWQRPGVSKIRDTRKSLALKN